MSQVPAALEPTPSTDLGPIHAERLEQLPPEIGSLIIGIGIVGLIFPGPFGTPLIIAGGLSLWPKAFRPADKWMARKFPKSHAGGAHWLDRFMNDLEHRYPSHADSTESKPS